MEKVVVALNAFLFAAFDFFMKTQRWTPLNVAV